MYSDTHSLINCDLSFCWGIGVGGLTRGMATLSQSNQEPFNGHRLSWKTPVELGELAWVLVRDRVAHLSIFTGQVIEQH